MHTSPTRTSPMRAIAYLCALSAMALMFTACGPEYTEEEPANANTTGTNGTNNNTTPQGCEGLSEDACVADPACRPEYGLAPGAGNEAPGVPDNGDSDGFCPPEECGQDPMPMPEPAPSDFLGCVDAPTEGCAGLDENACIEDPSCEPIYSASTCAAPAPGEPDVPCDDAIRFEGCYESEAQGCYSDADCGPGQQCYFTGHGEPPSGGGCDCPPCAPGDDCLCDCAEDDEARPAPAEGYCGPAEEFDCYSDADCAPDELCVYVGGGGGGAMPAPCGCPPCEAGEECEPCNCGEEDPGFIAEGGYCEPRNDVRYCFDDRDCPADYFCNTDHWGGEPEPMPCECPPCDPDDPNCGDCTCGDEGDRIAAEGICEPRNDVWYCWEDLDCPNGMVCDHDAWTETPDEDWDEDCACEPCAPGEECPPCDCGGGAAPAPQGLCVEPEPAGCDDGSEPVCDMIAPRCIEGSILAVIDGCYECVNPDTCEPGAYDHCSDGTEIMCRMMTPICPEGAYATSRDGCWICADAETCDEVEPVDCFGAWIDEEGTCRAPNDGVYPSVCCEGIVPPPTDERSVARNSCGPADGPALDIEIAFDDEAYVTCEEGGELVQPGQYLLLGVYDYAVFENGEGTVNVNDPDVLSGYAQFCSYDGCWPVIDGSFTIERLGDDFVLGHYNLLIDTTLEDHDVAEWYEGRFDAPICVTADGPWCG